MTEAEFCELLDLDSFLEHAVLRTLLELGEPRNEREQAMFDAEVDSEVERLRQLGAGA